MRQRVTIAMALAGEPRILIADEPTTALDVTVQAQIVSLIAALLEQTRMGVIWVTHDLALLARIADRVMVMFAGRIMESASCEELFARPQHPYTRALLANLRESATAPPRAPRRIPRRRGCPFCNPCARGSMDICAARACRRPGRAAHGGQVACWALHP
jgi:peptide/nickel transport system ATP-binding protein